MNLSCSFNMRGTEKAFEEMLNLVIKDNPLLIFQYLEIGCATGNTLISVADFMDNYLYEWRVTGIDLVDGPFFNAREFLNASRGHDSQILFHGSGRIEPRIGLEAFNDITVILLKDGAKRLTPEPGTINFALIDGCHGAACVMADFLAIEESIAQGGIVAFHDAMPEDQGKGWQSHCNENINVLKAFDDLQLPGPNSPQARDRKGWKCIRWISGDKSPGSLEQNGNGFVFFQKL